MIFFIITPIFIKIIVLNINFKHFISFHVQSYSLLLSFIFLVFTFKNSFSKGDLTRQKAIEVKVNLKGETGKLHFFEPSTLKFETGKLYKLKLINLSDSKHYFTSESFQIQFSQERFK